MVNQRHISISPKWLDALDIKRRHAPEIYFPNDPVVGSAHVSAIRDSFEKIELSALFCVQGVPTFAYLVQDKYDQAKVIEAHANLWNQGLASLLLVITDETLRIFSLAKLPVRNADEEFENKCLIDTLNLSEKALKIKNLIPGAETGRLWQEHKDFFKLNERIDTYLLRNLIQSHEALTKDLDTDTAQALLMQTMFISYLEDRAIINDAYFHAVFDDGISSLYDVFTSGMTKNLELLFECLARDFNGNVFVSPCSFDSNTKKAKLTNHHLDILGRFRSGNEDMESGQRSFWGYNFQYIPVELISAVYDRFLGEKERERKDLGAYYTPMFLADTVMTQVWDGIPISAKNLGEFLDPACGSGVFLVRSFQLLCEQWKLERNVKSLQWSNLCLTLKRVHGWDINGNAVRVAIFSLYIALLEQVSPPDIKKLIKKGKILPDLWGETLIEQDFFTVDANKAQYDVIVGNPPWASRRAPGRKSIQWCSDNNYPMPGNEDAWAFTWKALSHLKAHGLASFLVPAMGFLHNPKSFKARTLLVDAAQVSRIINFSDLRFQLFGGATSPAALIMFSPATNNSKPYNIDYWSPKANLNLQIRQNITITSSDKAIVSSYEIKQDYFALKSRLWMRRVDSKLYKYLSSYERIGDFIKPFGRAEKHDGGKIYSWFIGQGFQPYNDGRSSKTPHDSQEVIKYPYLPVQHVNSLYQKLLSTESWSSAKVRRKGFEASYGQRKILVSRGIGTSQMRLQATYCEHSLTFQDILMAIVFPKSESAKAKVLTAYLNSKLAIWFAFHGTSSFGSGRPEVKQAELLELPFPSEKTLSKNGNVIEKEILDIIKRLETNSSDVMSPIIDVDFYLTQIDSLIYKYFGLSDEEISIVEDTVNYIIPASQPHQNTVPYIWGASDLRDRKEYATTLILELKKWLDIETEISTRLAGKNADFAILELSLDKFQSKGDQKYQELDSDLGILITKLMNTANIELPGNFTLIPDFRLFIENKLYLVKPVNKQYWMKSSALEDADSIALDLQAYLNPAKGLVH
ncbi:MAG: N-6 DNA methylase [Gammaproteobacteria bacterium]|nr:N-6 DNA methylase [Gammaproteobacteria bacterium]